MQVDPGARERGVEGALGVELAGVREVLEVDGLVGPARPRGDLAPGLDHRGRAAEVDVPAERVLAEALGDRRARVLRGEPREALDALAERVERTGEREAVRRAREVDEAPRQARALERRRHRRERGDADPAGDEERVDGVAPEREAVARHRGREHVAHPERVVDPGRAAAGLRGALHAERPPVGRPGAVGERVLAHLAVRQMQVDVRARQRRRQRLARVERHQVELDDVGGGALEARDPKPQGCRLARAVRPAAGALHADRHRREGRVDARQRHLEGRGGRRVRRLGLHAPAHGRERAIVSAERTELAALARRRTPRQAPHDRAIALGGLEEEQRRPGLVRARRRVVDRPLHRVRRRRPRIDRDAERAERVGHGRQGGGEGDGAQRERVAAERAVERGWVPGRILGAPDQPVALDDRIGGVPDRARRCVGRVRGDVGAGGRAARVAPAVVAADEVHAVVDADGQAHAAVQAAVLPGVDVAVVGAPDGELAPEQPRREHVPRRAVPARRDRVPARPGERAVDAGRHVRVRRRAHAGAGSVP